MSLSRPRLLQLTWLLLAILINTGCASSPTKAGWGQSVSWPTTERLAQATKQAATATWVWAPALGSALFSIDDFDEDFSDWVLEENPLAGNESDARDWSDNLQLASEISFYASAFLAPTGDDPKPWWQAKSKGVAVGVVAGVTTRSITSKMKSAVGRDRPDRSDTRSFPSGHTSNSSVHTTLAIKNLNYYDLSPSERAYWSAGIRTLSIGSGWMRMEGRKHYPSDVLFGMALGNFFGEFFHALFFADEASSLQSVWLHPVNNGWETGFKWHF